MSSPWPVPMQPKLSVASGVAKVAAVGFEGCGVVCRPGRSQQAPELCFPCSSLQQHGLVVVCSPQSLPT